MCHTPYAICHTPYAICHAPCAICHTPYTICHAPYTICHAPYSICHAPYAIAIRTPCPACGACARFLCSMPRLRLTAPRCDYSCAPADHSQQWLTHDGLSLCHCKMAQAQPSSMLNCTDIFSPDCSAVRSAAKRRSIFFFRFRAAAINLAYRMRQITRLKVVPDGLARAETDDCYMLNQACRLLCGASGCCILSKKWLAGRRARVW